MLNTHLQGPLTELMEGHLDAVAAIWDILESSRDPRLESFSRSVGVFFNYAAELAKEYDPVEWQSRRENLPSDASERLRDRLSEDRRVELHANRRVRLTERFLSDVADLFWIELSGKSVLEMIQAITQAIDPVECVRLLRERQKKAQEAGGDWDDDWKDTDEGDGLFPKNTFPLP